MSASGKGRGKGRPPRQDVERYDSGRIRDSERERTDPTPQTAAKVSAVPTCHIQRAICEKVLTAEQGQALSNYASDRRCFLDVRDVECKPGPLARIAVRDARDSTETLPSTWNTPMSDEERERRASRYVDAYAAIKATGDRRAASQAGLVVGGYAWTDAMALKNAARALKRFYLDGLKKVA